MNAPQPPDSLDPACGNLPAYLGTYRIVRRLATGSASDVLLGCAEGPWAFERAVVLKVLLGYRSSDEVAGQALAQLSAAYARLSHPGVVRLYDFFEDNHQLVLVLEYVDGLPLNKLRVLLASSGEQLGDGPSMYVAWRIFNALSAAHTAQDPVTGEIASLIHRDINPSSVLIPWDGHVKVADFGLPPPRGAAAVAPAGLPKATYGYLAPEQALGHELTPQADIYSACVVLWELLTGRKAVLRAGASEGELVQRMASPSFPALASLRPDLPSPLLDAVQRGLERAPERRALSAHEMCQVLADSADLHAARKLLVDMMGSLRAPPVHEELPMRSAITVPDIESTYGPTDHVALKDSPTASPRAVRVGAMLAAIVGAATVCAAVALFVANGSAARKQPQSHPLSEPSHEAAGSRNAPALGVPSRMPEPAGDPSASSAIGKDPAAATTSGTISVPPSRAGHRVWVDDRLIGESPGTFVVRCGAHSVRVGSRGNLQRVNVPCDTDVVVE
jgi:serine/threonine-protein kinase